ncbi:MAG: 1-acyl-sn-glycerol-3-phosphate acyltransferase [Spirulinaceae cyanobacterium]
MNQLLRPFQNNQEKSKAKDSSAVNSYISPWLTRFAYPLGRRLVLPFYFSDIEVRGQENVPHTGPVILAPTHRSRWDALLIPYATGRCVTGRDLRFMVTSDEVKGVQGWFIRRLGGFSVDTKRPTVSSLRHGVDLLRQGEMVVIFPEGNIYRGKQVSKLKCGLARLALQAQASQPEISVKVLPISLDYEEAVPRRGCGVKIDIGTPLDVAKYQSTSSKKAAKSLMQDLETTLIALTEPVSQSFSQSLALL